MNIQKPGKIIAFIAIFTICIQSIMDLNSTHMTNPLWTPHARFHWSIQYFSSMILNIVSIYLLYGTYEGAKSRLSFVFATLGPLLFWGMFFPSSLMPGTSAWPDGQVPFAIIAPNVVIAVIMTVLCLFALVWDKRLRLATHSSSDAGKGLGCNS